MHTTNIENFTFIHNGDYSGNAQIQRESWERPVYIPCSVLLEFAAELVRNRKIEALEQADAAELLGLKQP